MHIIRPSLLAFCFSLPFFSAVALGRSVYHKTCEVYLIKEKDWSSFKEPLIKRGYFPVELPHGQIIDQGKDGDLALGYNYKLEGGRFYNLCAVEVTIQRFRFQGPERKLASADIAVASGKQYGRGALVACDRADSSAIANLPKCELKE